MGFFTNLFHNWALGKQKKELADFVSNMESMDARELGTIVAITSHVRHILEDEGHNVLNPFIYSNEKPEFPFNLSTMIRHLQKNNQMLEAAGTMVWLHTARAGIRLELRKDARRMWKELERGFPYIEDGVNDIYQVSGIVVPTDGYNSFPIGLTPEPKN